MKNRHKEIKVIHIDFTVSVTLILNGSPQKIVQRGQITAPRRSIDITISADYSIFENEFYSDGKFVVQPVGMVDFLIPVCREDFLRRIAL